MFTILSDRLQFKFFTNNETYQNFKKKLTIRKMLQDPEGTENV